MFGPKKDLETIVVARGLLSQAQREQAVRHAVQCRVGFADAAVQLGYATEDALARALSEEYGYPYATRENRMLEVELGRGLEKTIPENFAREHIVLPVYLEDKLLSVAFANPENLYVVENLKVLSGYQVQPLVATKTEILKALDQLYQGGSTDLIAQTMRRQAPDEGGSAEPVRAEARVDLDQAIGGGEGAYAVNLVNAILKQAIAERCSDVHLECQDREVMLRLRIDGVLHPRVPPPYANFAAIVSRIKILARLDIAERRLPQDGSFSLKHQNRVIDVRVSACPASDGEKIVMRLLDKDAVPLDLNRLGFEGRQKEDFLWAAGQPNGLILLTGPTGSGKTTTLYSLLNTIKTPGKNFMSIEDPIEIKLHGMTQVAVHAAIGLTFASALRSFLRQDPDVILVGEVRDLETAQTCLRAALTGHLVLSTLHTNDALASVVRLLDLGAEPYLIASSLGLVAAQRLLRVLCPACRKPYKPGESLLAQCLQELRARPADPAKLVFYAAEGCEKCAKTGYAGRMSIYEVYRLNDALRDAITRDRGDMGKLREAARASGFLDLRASGWHKVLRGLTTVEEILAVTTAR